MTNNELKNKLEAIAHQKENTIEKQVALEALGHVDIKTFFEDLQNYGCISGMVGSLVYTHDTHTFFDMHYHQIEEIREECEDSIGEPLRIKNDLKNFLAWFGFEQTAYNMVQELGLEV
ncbi:hypothetical protein L0P88_13825 [Muricauda sp. SCSIO 64092]|uniref:DUF7222 domain-containing protein n=1 Tax=Allomuricauda sp. SCSIO 64092 TaxID=2908842 RepID=UPI001FF2521C|nr:hypothetical protein [Muricauda sp. SCSIO 64092]UOY05031.1 hypothetical protein L0P88_13825 [Muricauda sp. SCSIO 64092]